MTKRKSISTRTRFDIFKRDNFSCQYCGGVPPKAVLHIDHIHPVSKGGDNSPSNLATACSLCNGGKSAKLLSSVPQSLQEQAIAIKESERQLKSFNKMVREQKQRIDEEAWEVVAALTPHRPSQIGSRDFVSIKNFIGRIGLFPTIEAAEIAWEKRRGNFKYFCGVCWNKAREIEYAR